MMLDEYGMPDYPACETCGRNPGIEGPPSGTSCHVRPSDELCRCGHPESQHGPDGCTAPTRLVGDMTYAERPCYCETFSDCYEGDPS